MRTERQKIFDASGRAALLRSPSAGALSFFTDSGSVWRTPMVWPTASLISSSSSETRSSSSNSSSPEISVPKFSSSIFTLLFYITSTLVLSLLFLALITPAAIILLIFLLLVPFKMLLNFLLGRSMSGIFGPRSELQIGHGTRAASPLTED